MALDAALGAIDGNSSSTPQQRIDELEARLRERDSEVASLTSAVKRLEALAFADSSSEPGSARSATNTAEIKFLKETNDEQNKTIKLQKSTIGSLKEEVELLTRQITEQANNNQINAEKQKQVQATQRAEQARLAEQAEKLARDKQEFAKHLKEFKDVRKKENCLKDIIH